MSTRDRRAKSPSPRIGRRGALGLQLGGVGSGASSSRGLTLFSLAFLAFLLVPAGQALAGVTVNLAGTGTGTVTSTPAGIDCSNVPGAEKSECSFEFGFASVELVAVPANLFTGWSGNALNGTCNSGSANPCTFTGAGSIFPYAFTATFEAPSTPPPVATTGGTADLQKYSATLEGSVDPEGSPVGGCHFEYGPTSAYGQTAPCRPETLGEGTAAVTVRATATSLEPNSTYHYQLVGSNPGGESQGGDRTFTTPAAPPSAQAFYSVGAGGVRLEGVVNPNNEATTYRFEYGRVDCDGGACLSVPASGVDVVSGGKGTFVSQVLIGLSPGALYHFRIVATNGAGTMASADQTFEVPPAGGCPNEDIRRQQASTYLPDCMALEMVSPPEKGGQPATEPWLASDGDHVRFMSLGALGGAHNQISPLRGDNYVASRGQHGWVTATTLAPSETGFGNFQIGQPQVFTPDFGRWLSFQATKQQAVHGAMTVYEGSLVGGDPAASVFAPRSPLLRPIKENPSYEVATQALISGASSSLSHIFFVPGWKNNPTAPRTAYLEGDPEPVQASGSWDSRNTYVVSDGPGGEMRLALLARDSSGKVWGGNCTAWVGGGVGVGGPGGRNQGAISADGTRVYLSTKPAQPFDSQTGQGPVCDTSEPVRIFTRTEAARVTEIVPLLPGEGQAGWEEPGDDFFEGASADGKRVYFTSNRRLAPTDGDAGGDCNANVGGSQAGCDLYLFEADAGGGKVIQVSAGEATAAHPTPGVGADVFRGVTAISGDGSHVYYVARGVLTEDPNPEGAVASEGALNLYVYERDAAHPSGHTAFIGDLDSSCTPDPEFSNNDCLSLIGTTASYSTSAVAVPMRSLDAGGPENGGDGDILVFKTLAPLAANDTDGLRLDVYRYDAAQRQLQCLSCRPGGDDGEPFSVRPSPSRMGGLPGPDFAEASQWVSEDGRSVVFATGEPLVGDDSDEEINPYLWANGGLTRLPAARTLASFSHGGAAFAPVVSHNGSEVAFETATPLLPEDRDTAEDIYVARVDGGTSNPILARPPCSGEACQGSPSTAMGPADPATASFGGRGNVRPPQTQGRRCSHGKQRSGKRRRSGRCTKKRKSSKHCSRHNSRARKKRPARCLPPKRRHDHRSDRKQSSRRHSADASRNPDRRAGK